MFEKTKKFIEEYPAEICLGVAFGILAVVGGIAVYNYGVNRGANKVGKVLGDTLPKIVDECGFNGFVSCMDAIEKFSPKMHEIITGGMATNNFPSVEPIFNSKPYIKECLEFSEYLRKNCRG